MAIYRLIGDAEFEAQDLNEAFSKLAKHFDNLRKGSKSPLFKKGDMQLRRRGNLILPSNLDIKVTNDS